MEMTFRDRQDYECLITIEITFITIISLFYNYKSNYPIQGWVHHGPPGLHGPLPQLLHLLALPHRLLLQHGLLRLRYLDMSSYTVILPAPAGEAPATTPPYVPTMAPGGSVAPGGGSSNASYCAMDADHTMCQYPVGGALELLYTCDCLIAIVLQGMARDGHTGDT